MDALWSLKENHEGIGEAKKEHKCRSKEKGPDFALQHFESISEAFINLVVLGKSFPTHIHMRQSDERVSGKVRFKNGAESWKTVRTEIGLAKPISVPPESQL